MNTVREHDKQKSDMFVVKFDKYDFLLSPPPPPPSLGEKYPV
jgi:hypothetical protein